MTVVKVECELLTAGGTCITTQSNSWQQTCSYNICACINHVIQQLGPLWPYNGKPPPWSKHGVFPKQACSTARRKKPGMHFRAPGVEEHKHERGQPQQRKPTRHIKLNRHLRTRTSASERGHISGQLQTNYNEGLPLWQFLRSPHS